MVKGVYFFSCRGQKMHMKIAAEDVWEKLEDNTYQMKYWANIIPF